MKEGRRRRKPKAALRSRSGFCGSFGKEKATSRCVLIAAFSIPESGVRKDVCLILVWQSMGTILTSSVLERRRPDRIQKRFV